jgi:hypothetical protein
MSKPDGSALFPYPHLTVDPLTTSELLFADFDGHPPIPNVRIIGLEAYEAEAPDILLATLGQAGLVASQAQIDTVRQTILSLREHRPRIEARARRAIDDASERVRTAYGMIQGAHNRLHSTYFDPVVDPEEGSPSRVFNRMRFAEVEAETGRFNGELSMRILSDLDRAHLFGIAPAEVVMARRILRLLYADSQQLSPVEGGRTPTQPTPAPTVVTGLSA